MRKTYLTLLAVFFISIIQAQVSRTNWQMLDDLYNNTESTTAISMEGIHGNPVMYNYANVPSSNDPRWTAAPLNGSGNIQFSQTSRLPSGSCYTRVDFTYFQTILSIPANITVNTCIIGFGAADDGVRAYVFNSAYPNGTYLPGSEIKLGQGNVTSNIATLLRSGEANRIVLVQGDDCPTGNNLTDGSISINGTTVNNIDGTPPAVTAQNVTVHLNSSGQASIVTPGFDSPIFTETFAGEPSGSGVRTSLTNWNLSLGSNVIIAYTPDVDLGDYILNNGSNEIDLAGYHNSKITSKKIFQFVPGQYKLTFDNRLNNNPAGGNSVKVTIGNLLNQDFVSNTSMTSESVTFTVTQVTSAALAFEQLGTDDAAGSFIGNINLSRVIPQSYSVLVSASDENGLATVSVSKSTFNCTNLGANAIQLMVTDAYNNTTTRNVTVTVIDNLVPTITCPSNKTLASCETVIPDYTTSAVVTDNCTTTITQSPAAGTTIASGATVTVTLTARDGAGNSSNCTFTVTRPNITPVAKNDVTSVCAGGSVNINVLSNDTHPQNAALTINDFSSVTPSQGTLVKNADNTFTYTAPANYSGPVTFTYTTKANDGTQAFSGNSHYYEWVPSTNITWSDAKLAASQRTFNGLKGYLVTITSAAEMSFVASKLKGSGWLGASDLASEGIWRWVTGPEGLENGGMGRHFSGQLKTDNCFANTAPGINGNYANWSANEPNDCGADVNEFSATDQGRGGEHYAHFTGTGGVWNDYPNSVGNNHILGYVTEYGGLEGCIPVLTATATVTITVNQLPAPVITANGPTSICPGKSVTLTASAGSSYLWSNGATTQSITANQSGNYSVTVINAEGCSSTSAATTVTVEDNLPPVPNVSNLPVINGECAVVVRAPLATDNCAGTIVATTSDPLSYATQGTYTVHWVYDDGNGNKSYQNQTVVVKDVTPPVITCPFNITVNAEAGKCGATVNYNQPSATDNCGSGTLPTSLPGYIYKGTHGGHTYFVSEARANPEDAHAAAIALGGHLVTISSEDENDFVSAMRPGEPMWIGFTDRSVEGTFRWITNEPVNYTNWANAEPNDCCSGTNHEEDWAVINWLGSKQWNDWFYNQPAYYVVEFEGGTIPTTFVSGQLSGSFFPIGTTTIKYSATDAGGNDVSCSFTITVLDKEIPVITSNGNKSVNADAGRCGALVEVSATAQDNCGVGSPTGVRSDGHPLNAEYPVGTTTITWNVRDIHGNDAITVTQTVVVADDQLPVITSNGNKSVNADAGRCGALVEVSATAKDNCGVGAPTGVRNDALPLNAEYPVGTTTITWNVRDVNGNDAITVTQTVVVADDQLPVITSNGNKSVNSDAGRCGAMVEVSATATDNCGVGDPTGVRNDGLALDAEYPVGTTTITWNVRDIHGNPATTFIQKIVVSDKEIPVITTNGDKGVGSDPKRCGAAVEVSATASDNCGVGSPTGVRSDGLPLDAEYPVGTTIITWNVTDMHGNAAATVTQTVTVKDVELPVITCPQNISVLVNNAGCTYQVSGTTFDATATDNCGVDASTYHYTLTGATSGTGSSLAGVAFNKGTTTVTWQVTDIHGNVSIPCSYTVTVSTTIAVTISSNSVLPQGVNANTVYNGYTPGATLSLKSNPSGGGGGYTYKWSVNTPGFSIVNNTATSQTVNVAYNGTGDNSAVLTVEVTDQYGCKISNTITVYGKDIRCGNKMDKVLVCHNTGSAKNPWVQVCIAPAAVATHLANGSYLGNCSNNLRTVPTTPIVKASAVKAYPNPTNGVFELQLIDFAAGKVQVQIFDNYGKLIDTRSVTISYKREDVSFNLSHVASGVYQVRVIANDGTVTTKVVIGR